MGEYMRVQDAVEQALTRMGVANQQPELPAQSLLHLWQLRVADSADHPSFTCLGQTLSYSQLDQLADRVAAHFHHQFKFLQFHHLVLHF